MKIVGLITEYNPFHNGHLYHLNESKKITNSEYSIAVMSGNFLQRGEPALVDKWTRAKMAVDNGVDLVVELPVVYACQSAELFAYGAIKILDSLGIVDSICFGSELGNIQPLDYIAEILNNEPKCYKEYLRSELEQGNSFPRAREKALINYLGKTDSLDSSMISSILSNPNNILSIEYLKSIKKIDSSIKPFTLKREKSSYHDKAISNNISSATAIREQLINTSLENIKHTVPHITYKYLESFYNDNKDFNSLNNFSMILLYLLRNSTPEILKNILDVSEGLDNRIIDCSSKYNCIDDILNCVSTKRYTMTRLKRIIIHLLLSMNKNIIRTLHSYGPQYIRILGLNSKGIDILRQAKKTSSLPIITKFADYPKLNNKILNQMIELDKKATDVYILGLSRGEMKMNLDYTMSPYIKLNSE
ncbi:nucleotidyltransferase [Proteiniborus sp. MB09-C3]|uniref:nucleotidyltransferase n=1 Tax=Proteiniborus sp. MB09-C3 TaxID=3050072 RepID=UPI002552FBE7|nr:nucleotidyltransferase [Proteiniborus sp. MB09-C3]WIV10819.1 nucleotidyltransferase [Proteiniborus sp. MB09-C3]